MFFSPTTLDHRFQKTYHYAFDPLVHRLTSIRGYVLFRLHTYQPRSRKLRDWSVYFSGISGTQHISIILVFQKPGRFHLSTLHGTWNSTYVSKIGMSRQKRAAGKYEIVVQEITDFTVEISH